MKVYIDTKKRQLFVVATVLLCHIFINTITVSALTYQNSVNVEFTINPTISISLSSPDLIIDNLTPGSSSDSNIITVDVSTNAGYGYYMSATAGTSTGNTNLSSTTSSIVFTNLSANTATLNAFPDNYWGYSYSTDNGTTWISGSHGDTSTGYNGLPLDNDDSGATGVILAETDSFTNTGSIKFKIGAKAAATQATGTYTNTVNFYAVANPEPTLGPVSCEAGKICYNVNSLTQTEGTMGKQNAASDGNTTTLLASNFSRQGYGFAGWSDTYDYSGNLYGPQEEITIPTGTSTNGLSLYAIWVKSEGSIQDSANVARVCNSLTQSGPNVTKTINSVSALTDQRDGETYAIAKLADGNCWMIENLRLESTAAHNSDGSLAQGYSTSTTYGNFAGLADVENANFSNSTTANSLYSTDGSNDTINIGSGSNPGYRMPRYNNYNHKASSADRPQNPTTNSDVNSTTNASMYSYGNYYTWSATLANTIYYDSPTATDTDGKTSETVNTSLCPAGWILPRGGNKSREATNDFWALVATGINNGTNPANYSNSTQPCYNGTPEGRDVSSKLRSYPNNFLYSGNFETSSAKNRGGYGQYWSSTASNGNSSSELYFDTAYVYPGTRSESKYYGLSIRCIASPST